MRNYDHKRIERKWQKQWEKEHLYRTEDRSRKRKQYVLDMFPYPSGVGLHVGHPRGYIATDIYSRFKRMNECEVLHPMGWDAFGLPAENFALKNNVHPRSSVEQNVRRFKEQLSVLGFDYDWSREINTTDPEYYRWTQWIFLQMFKKGFAYESHEPINWCPSCKTGLANEDLEDGLCERCGSAVEQKPLRQWVLRITDYADRLLKDLDTLINWPESVKEAQRNWIGRSEGAEITFPVITHKKVLLASNNPSKRERIQKLLRHAGLTVEVVLPKEEGIEECSVPEDGKTLFENAKQKAGAYSGKTKLPVLAGDTGFYIKGENLDPVRVKRNALKKGEEERLSQEQIARKMVRYYNAIAKKHGGEVDAAWKDVWVLLMPDGEIKRAPAQREVTLTTKRKGKIDPHFPLRGLYYSRKTGNHTGELTKEEEMEELAPVGKALGSLLTRPLPIFTTRPDTLFGATYMVVAPEHPLVESVWKQVKNKQSVRRCIDTAKKKTELQRTAEEKKKTGVELKGVTALNPATKEEIPIWVADYVMGHYGTGAIMAVPAHDDRDFEFAQKKGLPIRYVVIPKLVDKWNPPKKGKPTKERKTIHALVSDPATGKMLFLKWKKHDWTTFIVGGVDADEDVVEAARREVAEETGYTDLAVKKVMPFPVEAHYFAAHKDENRKAYTTAVHFELKSKKREPVSKEEEEKHDPVWLDLNDVVDTLTCAELDIWQRWLKEGADFAYTGEGVLIDSSDFSGMESGGAKDALRKVVAGKKRVTYKLKDWVFSRQRYWGEPIPLIHCAECGVVPVPESDLPVELPNVKSYEPTGTGESPLAAISSWVNTQCPKCGHAAKRETNTMPQWAGSCWYYLRYIDPKNSKRLVDPKKEQYWMTSPGGSSDSDGGVDMYVGGVEHATRHLIYARFWHKFLYDIGVVSTAEPFRTLRNQGLILGPDGRKMSKRWGNVINPDEVVSDVGADSMRLYEMFMGPFEQSTSWNPDGVKGVRRFLERVWALQGSLSDTAEVNRSDVALLNRTIKQVTEDIERFSFNTTVSALMILANRFAERSTIHPSEYDTLLTLLAPLAPHITEELWRGVLGRSDSVHRAPWPSFNKSSLLDDTVTVAVQVNGKVRGEISVPRDLSREEVFTAADRSPVLRRWWDGKKPTRVIHVPNRLINIVVDS